MSSKPRHTVVSGLLAALLGALSSAEVFAWVQEQKLPDLDYVFVCSTVPGLDAHAVEKFYHDFVTNSTNPEFFDDVRITSVDTTKKYLLLSFAIKPVSPSNIDCINRFPKSQQDWIRDMVAQDERVGKKIRENAEYIPLSAFFGPVLHNTISLNKDNITFRSSIMLHNTEYLACESLAYIFQLNIEMLNIACGIKNRWFGEHDKR